MDPQSTINVKQGFGWAIAKALAEAGAEISLGVWVRASAPWRGTAALHLFNRPRRMPAPACDAHTRT